jgi:hypothetical protein
MKSPLRKIAYKNLNSRQKENYNYQKLSGLLADYGYTTIRLTSDWKGADFIAQHKDGKSYLLVQLKGRLTFAKKYMGRNIWIGFPYKDAWYLVPHDFMVEIIMSLTKRGRSNSWEKYGGYSFPYLSDAILKTLTSYKLR